MQYHVHFLTIAVCVQEVSSSQSVNIFSEFDVVVFLPCLFVRMLRSGMDLLTYHVEISRYPGSSRSTRPRSRSTHIVNQRIDE